MIQSLERQSEAKNMPFCLKMIKMASFRAVKHPYLRLKTSKLKMVESFENFGKKLLMKNYLAHLVRLKAKNTGLLFFAQILKEILKEVQSRLGNDKRP